jgi:hypothetical protein
MNSAAQQCPVQQSLCQDSSVLLCQKYWCGRFRYDNLHDISIAGGIDMDLLPECMGKVGSMVQMQDTNRPQLMGSITSPAKGIQQGAAAEGAPAEHKTAWRKPAKRRKARR